MDTHHGQDAASQSPSLLLVDDERDFVETLALRLETRGFTVLRAYDAASGLAVLQNREVDVVVLDLNLPGRNGLEMLTDIRQLRPFTEVIMLTGESGVQRAIEGMKRGVLDYLIKPVAIENLIASIRQAKAHRNSRLESRRMVEMAKLASTGLLAQGVAHEINNPVNIMSHEAGWIMDLLDEEEFAGCANLPELKRAAGKIQGMAQRCKQITSKLLILGRQQDTLLRGVDLSTLIDTLLASRATLAAELRVAVERDIGPLPERLDLSAADLEQILANLVDNGLDALGEKGGTLSVKVALENQDLILVVADDGHGIDAADLPRIFEPFYSTRAVGKGTGLGLSIAGSIVNNLAGDIQVQSEFGRGAVFKVRIPLLGRLAADDAAAESLKSMEPATENVG